jgi:hypothetical protein
VWAVPHFDAPYLKADIKDDLSYSGIERILLQAPDG